MYKLISIRANKDEIINKLACRTFKVIIFDDGKSIYPIFSVANKYLKIFKNDNRSASTKYDEYMNIVKNLLNYILTEFGIIFDFEPEKIKYQMIQDYIDVYSMTLNAEGDLPGQEARKRVRNKVSEFMKNVKEASICPNLEGHYFINEKSAVRKRMYEYELVIQRTSSLVNKFVYRNCPKFFVDEFLLQARAHDIDLYMRACLQVDAGLRPSESGNVRMRGSKYGDGYKVIFDSSGEEIILLSLDLSREYHICPLRSDGVDIGGIKKPRIVEVPTQNVRHLYTAICEYEKATENRDREDSKPLITNQYKSSKTGKNMAMSYSSYQKRFHRLVKDYVIPSLKAQGREKAAYAEILENSNYGPHFFREYFTCQLTASGMEWAELMKARGDKSPESAITYILKGRGFADSINETNHMLANEILNRGIKSNEKKLPLQL